MIVGIASSIFFQSVLPGIVCWVFMNIIVFYLEFYPPAFGVAGGGYAGGGGSGGGNGVVAIFTPPLFVAVVELSPVVVAGGKVVSTFNGW